MKIKENLAKIIRKNEKILKKIKFIFQNLLQNLKICSIMSV